MNPAYRLYPYESSDSSLQRKMDSPQALRWTAPAISQSDCKEPTIDVTTDEYTWFSNEASNEHSCEQPRTAREGERERSTTISSLESDNTVSLDVQTTRYGLRQSGKPMNNSKRSILIPPRTSSSSKLRKLPDSLQLRPTQTPRDLRSYPSSPTLSEAAFIEIRESDAQSRSGSVLSRETAPSSLHVLPHLQTIGPDNSDAQYVDLSTGDDPRSWNIIVPTQADQKIGSYSLERRAEKLFSAEHLQKILSNPKLSLQFMDFLSSQRPSSIRVLTQYLDAQKALRAISYANAIVETIYTHKDEERCFIAEVTPTRNHKLEEVTTHALGILVKEDLPAYITHTWARIVSASIHGRITGILAPHLKEASEGLAEVFCLTDPTRNDNPIILASEEFTRTTQYGLKYIVGRNCRFLQGPRSGSHSIQRLAIACASNKEHTEVFVNYRRDGSPFLNLLMMAPLMDSKGNVRYFIGAQVDISGLLKDCSEMDGLAELVDEETHSYNANNTAREDESGYKDKLRDLSEMFNSAEVEIVRRYAGAMQREYLSEFDHESFRHNTKRVLIKDESHRDQQADANSVAEDVASVAKEDSNGRLRGVFQHYLLIRPEPPFRILFTSPSLRLPGILQSEFFHRIGGSGRVRADLRAALTEGSGVTARIYWLYRPDENGEGEGRPRWVHCTPLLHHSRAVGVFMIVLVDDEGSLDRRYRQAPPVAHRIIRREDDVQASRRRFDMYERKQRDADIRLN